MNENIDIIEYIRLQYSKKIRVITPNNDLFWDRYKMKKEIDEWKDNLDKSCKNVELSGDIKNHKFLFDIATSNFINECHKKLLNYYDEMFSAVVGEIFKNMYHETNNQ